MKIHKETVEAKKVSGLLTYESALSHIAKIFENEKVTASFDYNCVCEFSGVIENNKIVAFSVSYDKILVMNDTKSFFWPILKHTRNVSIEEGEQFLENLRKKT